jgi:hypothetical protein
VPAFNDYALREVEGDEERTAVRGGLAWMDEQCRTRWGKDFVACAATERAALLDDIAWPDKARPEMSHGVAFFSLMRDLVAGGFFSSRIGVRDLGYRGNEVLQAWNGCPPEALAKLGVAYDDGTA